MAALSAADEPIPDPTGMSLCVTTSTACLRFLVRYLRWGCLLKSRRSPFMVFHLERRIATVILRSAASTIAGIPYTTECSPRMTNFPGADAVCHWSLIPDRTFSRLR